MAVDTDSIPAPNRRLLRAAGPGHIMTSADIPALVSGKDLVAAETGTDGPTGLPRPLGISARHTRVLRQHDVGRLPRAPQGLVTGVRLSRHGPFSRSVLPTSVRLRS